jgi:hypothetical protein
MNCETCGRYVSITTAGKTEGERSDLDGAPLISSMWCKKCSKKETACDLDLLKMS